MSLTRYCDSPAKSAAVNQAPPALSPHVAMTWYTRPSDTEAKQRPKVARKRRVAPLSEHTDDDDLDVTAIDDSYPLALIWTGYSDKQLTHYM